MTPQKKNENEVKKPLSAYMLWCKAHREKYAKPGMPPTEVMKKMGEEWKKLSEKEKQVWSKNAVQDKKRYDQEMQ